MKKCAILSAVKRLSRSQFQSFILSDQYSRVWVWSAQINEWCNANNNKGNSSSVQQFIVPNSYGGDVASIAIIRYVDIEHQAFTTVETLNQWFISVQETYTMSTSNPSTKSCLYFLIDSLEIISYIINGCLNSTFLLWNHYINLLLNHFLIFHLI